MDFSPVINRDDQHSLRTTSCAWVAIFAAETPQSVGGNVPGSAAALTDPCGGVWSDANPVRSGTACRSVRVCNGATTARETATVAGFYSASFRLEFTPDRFNGAAAAGYIPAAPDYADFSLFFAIRYTTERATDNATERSPFIRC
ncbi:hypothetical protein [Spirulina sp.]|uniref:hypothetical protein n=1 Tax=Spirulina sp. TaxID=1157 RepID=UPI003F6F510C